ncbi:MAG: PAS domain S-box protein [Anaerolineae bacterium]
MSKLSIRLIIAVTLVFFALLQVGLFYLFIAHILSHISSEVYASGEHILLIVEAFLLVIITLVGILTTLFLMHGLIFRRLNKLIAATEQFANGKLSTRVDMGGHDELTKLGTAFNIMAQRVETAYQLTKENENKLSEKESRLSAVVNATVDGMIIANTHGLIEIMNPAAERIFGYQANEIMGQKLSSLLASNETLSTLSGSMTYLKREVMGRRKDGSLFPIDMALSTAAYGDQTLFTAIVRDITERKRSETALNLYAQRLDRQRAIVEAILMADTMEAVAQAAVDQIRELIPCQRAHVSSVEASEGRVVHLAVSTELPTQLLPPYTIILSKSDMDWVRQQEHFYIHDLDTRKDRTETLRILYNEGIRSLLTLPLVLGDELIGTLNLGATTTSFFTEEHTQIAREIAAQLALGMRQVILLNHVAHYAEELGERVIMRTAEAQTFRRMVENSLDGIVIIDSQKSLIIYANRAAHQMYGYEASATTLIGQDPRVFWFKEDYPIITQVLNGARKTGWSGDVRQRRVDGSVFEVSANAFALYDPDDRLQFGVSIRDITARKQAEKSLQRINNFQQAILNSARSGIISTDLNGIITSFNPGAEQILGYSTSEVVGRLSITIFYDPSELQAHAEAISHGLEIHLRAGAEALFAQASLGRSAEAEWALIRKDGSRLPALISTTAIRDEVGGIAGFLSIVTDVTRQKQAENRFRALMESAPDAMVVINPEGKIVLVNTQAEKLFGYDRRQMLQREVELLMPAADYPHHSKRRENFMGHPQIQTMGAGLELWAQRADGSRFPVEVSLSPIEFEDTVLIASSIRDITQRKEAEKALLMALEKERELGELKSRFVSMASHEFRTPLATILATADALGAYRHKMDDSQIDHRINKIRNQVNHLRDIMDDVLQLARMQANRIEFSPARVDFDEFCRDILDEFQSQPSVTHELVYTCSERPLYINADTKLLRKIIDNLVSNAIKYSPNKTHVYVDVMHEDGHLQLKVRDEGIGIPEEDQKHLFEAFHRGVNVGTISGTGLGLSIAWQSIELHGGTILCESLLGEGTTFTVTLPSAS